MISTLENYLDNICSNGNKRLDLAVKNMVMQQKEFLDRFHEKVSNVLETTFSAAANKIADQFAEVNELGRNVYTNFSHAAGTISTGASTFQSAANSLHNQTQTLTNFITEFKSSVETFKTTANQLEQNNIIQNIDRVLAELNTSQQAFTASTTTLDNALIGITTSNRKAAQIAKQIYETWQDSTSKIVMASETISAGAIKFEATANSLEGQTQTFATLIPELTAGVNTFASAANKVKTNNIVKHLDTVITNLSTTQAAFATSAETLTTGVAGIITNNQQTTELANRIYDGLGMSTEGIQKGANSLLDAAQLIQDSQLAVELTKAAQGWQTAQAEFTNSTAIFSQAAQNIQPVATKLEPAIVSIDRAVTTLQHVGTEVVSLSRNNVQISESTQTAITGFDRNYQQVLNNTESSIQSLAEINRSNLQQLITTLESKLRNDNSQVLQSIEAMKEYLAQMKLTDREAMARLSIVLEKIEIGLRMNSSNDAFSEDNGGRKSKIFSGIRLK